MWKAHLQSNPFAISQGAERVKGFREERGLLPSGHTAIALAGQTRSPNGRALMGLRAALLMETCLPSTAAPAPHCSSRAGVWKLWPFMDKASEIGFQEHTQSNSSWRLPSFIHHFFFPRKLPSVQWCGSTGDGDTGQEKKKKDKKQVKYQALLAKLFGRSHGPARITLKSAHTQPSQHPF